MQQREQLILKRLAEARRAQASALARFTQAHARMTQVEARLQALRARLAASSTPEETTDQPADSPVNAPSTPASQENSAAQILPETPVPSFQASDEVPMAYLEPQSAGGERQDEEEDTKKQRAIAPVRPSAQASQQNTEDEETLFVDFAELIKKREAERARSASQEEAAGTETTQAGEEATDITTKIPVIRRESHAQQEST